MASCPECANPLRTVRERGGIYLFCDHCSGRAMTFPQIRRCAGDRVVNELLHKIHSGTSPSNRICPYCAGPMRWFHSDNPPLVLHSCRKCDLVWFEAGQFEALPEGALAGAHQMAGKADEYLSQKPEKWNNPFEGAQQVPMTEVGWRASLTFLGLPVEVDRDLNAPKPWVTWSLAAVTSLVSMATFPTMQAAANAYGFIPAQAWRHGGLTFVTPFFLHAGWMHLIGNMYFLVIFGRRVENFLGRWRYGLLLLAATVASSALHLLMQPASTIPGIGASGGISGIIAFYALKFHKVRLGMLIRFRWVTIPAWVALVLWLGYQALLAEMQMLGMGTVNAFAHIGGAVAGIGAWAVWRKLRTDGGGRKSEGEAAPA
jgi:membrane associated rhomboid family serine protease